MAGTLPSAPPAAVGAPSALARATGRRRHAPPSPSRTLPDAAAREVARRLRVMGHPARVRLLALLRGGPLTVSKLAHGVALDNDVASKHLGVLLRAGLVRRFQDGVHGRYALADADVLRILVLALRVTQGHDRRLAELLRELDLGDDGP